MASSTERKFAGIPISPRLFVLERDHDVSGVSGLGTVADGVLWPNGLVSLCWRGKYSSVAHWLNLSDMERVHGHDGNTRVVWRL